MLLRNVGEHDRPEFGTRESLGIAADLGFAKGRVSQMVSVDWDGDGLTDLLVGFDDLESFWPDDDKLPRSQQIGFNQRAGHPGYDPNGKWRGACAQGSDRLVEKRRRGRRAALGVARGDRRRDRPGRFGDKPLAVGGRLVRRSHAGIARERFARVGSIISQFRRPTAAGVDGTVRFGSGLAIL